tara:strand:+ start:5930 stop:6643 length:714 start_codon:yes stop_codon:yes gene_type:complete
MVKENKVILGLIPARGGSKGIPLKNIKNIYGKPLLAYTAEAALKSKNLDRVILSTDSIEIKDVGEKYGLEVPFLRPKILSKDDSPTLPVIIHALENIRKKDNFIPDIVVLLQPTSPLRNNHHIDNAIKVFLDNENADSLVSVVKIPHNFSPYSALQKGKQNIVTPFLKHSENYTLRQKKPVFYGRNGALYISTRECIVDKKSMYGDITISYLMDQKNSLDIDSHFDLKVLECFLKKS